jgi:hypothetical protein
VASGSGRFSASRDGCLDRSVSLGTIATIQADTIYVRQIFVQPHALPRLSEGGITLTADGNESSVTVSGPRASVSLFGGPNAPEGPIVLARADGQTAVVQAHGASSVIASMGYLPNDTSAFRAHDSISAQDVWSAP